MFVVIIKLIIIRKYGSTLHVRLVQKNMAAHVFQLQVVAKLKSLLIYTDKLKYTYNL